jgi:hypothetical protein
MATWVPIEQSEPIENGRYLITFIEDEIPKVIETEFKDGLWFFGSDDEDARIHATTDRIGGHFGGIDKKGLWND